MDNKKEKKRSQFGFKKRITQTVLHGLLLLGLSGTFFHQPTPPIRSSSLVSFGNAVWMHVDTFEKSSPEALEGLSNSLNLHQIQSVLILGKKIDGQVPYPSHIALKSSQTQTMKKLVTSLRRKGMKVYFYYPVNTDPLWLQKHPEDMAIQVGRSSSSSLVPDPEKKLVNLTSSAYQQYISDLCVEAIQEYSLDGVQLDYIRYRNGQTGFSEAEKKKASVLGIDIQKIQDLTYQTFVKPGDWRTLLRYYDQKDPDVLKWAEVREEIVTGFFSNVQLGIRRKVKAGIGLTLVSSGATAEAYTAIHFGQNWHKLSALADFATPMAYHGSNTDPYTFVQEVCRGALKKIQPRCAIAIGLQAHATSSEHLMQAIQAVKDQRLAFVLFRIGTFSFSQLEIQTTKSLALEGRISWWNGCENQTISAYSIKKTGLALGAGNQDNLIARESDQLKWLMKKPCNLGEAGSGIAILEMQWNNAISCCLPMVVIHTNTSEVPTLQHISFKTDHLLFSIPANTTVYNDHPASPGLFRWQHDQTWVDLRELPPGLGIHMQADDQIFSLWDHQNGIKITYQLDSVRIKRRIHQNWFEEVIYPLTAEIGYLPVRFFFPAFRFHLFFNSASKQVHIVRWTSLIRSSIAVSSDEVFHPESLFLTDQAVWLEWDNFFSHSFYSLTKQIHAMGRSVVVFFPAEDVKGEKPEIRWFVMQNYLDRGGIPDDLVYWLSSETLLPSVPAFRTSIVPWSPDLNPANHPKGTLYRWERQNGFPDSGKKPLLLINSEKDPILGLSSLSRYYRDSNEMLIVNWQCTNRFEK